MKGRIMASQPAPADAPRPGGDRRIRPPLRPLPTAAIRRTVGRPRGSDSEARRRALVSAAVRVFATRGFDAATLSDVASLADITRPAVQHYFSGKTALYQAALDRAYQLVLAPLVDSPPATPLAALLGPDEPDLETRWARALLGSALAQPHRTAEVAPRVADIAAEVGRLCHEAARAGEPGCAADLLAAMVVGRWVLTASALPGLA
ncbi:hypothetical protein B1R94_17810 [Mycolicibacterium litorale]|nr:hypothetical protein B1R94_17810 [Mycolicibacterium litorale]